MIKSYLKTGWRNLIKNRASSFINVGGLALGMTVALLIGLWIYEELSFNRYHRNYDSIAQVMQHQNYNAEIRTDKAVPIPLGAELQRAYANDFKHVVLSSWTNAHLLTFGEKSISRQGNFMEPDAPRMLALKMTNGSVAGFQRPSSILLSQSVSKVIFGDADPIGQVIKLDTDNVTVTGIYEDLPDNTTFSNVAFIASWNVYAFAEDIKNAGGDWNQNSFQLFVQVAAGKKMAELSAKIKDSKLSALGPDGARLKPQVFLQPMSRWNLYAEFKNGVNTGGKIQYVWMFGIIGVFVLLLACINFMNLSTARSEKRAKEVGIRKAVGSLRVQLISQFYSESLMAAMFAFLLSLLMAWLSLPLFNIITDKKFIIPWGNPYFWLLGIGFSLITGLIAGSYPALYLSSFQPLKVLKGTFKAGRYAATPRRVLVILQFTVSVILIIGTIIVYRQIRFAKDRPVGYNREGLIMIRPYSSEYHDHFGALRNDLIQSGAVKAVAESSSSITKGSRTNGGLNWKGKEAGMADEFTTVGVSADYGKTVGWQFVAGRDFTSQFFTDSDGLIINEAAVKYMRLQQPLGTTVTWDKKYTIIGVIKNIVMTSPYEPVKPAIYYITPEAGYLNIKLSQNAKTGEALASIEAVCKKYSPVTPFDYKFADEEYARKFTDDQRIGNFAMVFAVLAIFISCLGLFGLASFMAEQRTKEIAIRKVLGASIFSLWKLQSGNFLLLVMISLLIATPTAYYFMYNWLENYTYRTELSWWVFATAGSGAIIITLLTVSYQSIKTAVSNPAKSLKVE